MESMQLNLYVPRDKEHVVRALDDAARRTGKAKNLLALEAIERHLQQLDAPRPAPRFRTFNLGVIEPWSRADIYEERLDHIMRPPETRVAERKGRYKPNR